jgi:hypothetical protein
MGHIWSDPYSGWVDTTSQIPLITTGNSKKKRLEKKRHVPSQVRDSTKPQTWKKRDLGSRIGYEKHLKHNIQQYTAYTYVTYIYLSFIMCTYV